MRGLGTAQPLRVLCWRTKLVYFCGREVAPGLPAAGMGAPPEAFGGKSLLLLPNGATAEVRTARFLEWLVSEVPQEPATPKSRPYKIQTFY